MSTPLTIQRLSGFGRGKTEQFSEQQIVLGTSPTCQMWFDPTWDKTVSPEHAVLSLDSDSWWLEDKSRDGCWVDGRRVSRLQLSPGIAISLGERGPKIQVDFEPVALTKTSEETPPAAVTTEVPSADSRSRMPAWLLPVVGGTGVIALLLVALAVRRHEHSDQQSAGAEKHSDEAAGAVVVVEGQQGTNQQASGVAKRSDDAAGAAVVEGQKDTDQQIAEVAKRHEDAVGVVVFVEAQRDGTKVPIPRATAWAIGEKVFVSNTHVSRKVSEAIDKGGSVFIVLNKHPEKKFQILRAVVHPRYAETNYNIDGKNLAVAAYDAGLLYVDGVAPNRFTIAPESELRKLDSGYRVAYLGFPTEEMVGGGVDFRNPVANMQSGILTSVTDYWLSQAPFERSLLLAHNLGATGGASGSPIFNSSGQVVGILSAGNIFLQAKLTAANRVYYERHPSAVMINFAQRIDVLRDIYAGYPK